MLETSPRILVVDDFASMRKLVRWVLKELGYFEIDEADNGKVALALILQAEKQAKPYNLVLSDCQMPEMNGADLLKEIAANKLNSIMFILMGGRSDEQLLKEIIAQTKFLNANYIVKPFSAATLKKKLREKKKPSMKNDTPKFNKVAS